MSVKMLTTQNFTFCSQVMKFSHSWVSLNKRHFQKWKLIPLKISQIRRRRMSRWFFHTEYMCLTAHVATSNIDKIKFRPVLSYWNKYILGLKNHLLTVIKEKIGGEILYFSSPSYLLVGRSHAHTQCQHIDRYSILNVRRMWKGISIVDTNIRGRGFFVFNVHLEH